MKTNNQIMGSFIPKVLIAAVIAACFSLNVQAGNGSLAADTGKKMDKMKMSKMKMDKKMDKKKMSKMKKDTTSKM